MSAFSSMVFRKKAAAVAVAFFFVGCSVAMAQNVPPPSAGIRFDPDQPGCIVRQTAKTPMTCDFDEFIGTPLTSIDRSTFGGRVFRVIHEGDMVTQDFSPDRITVTLDAEGKIIRMTCG